MNVLEIVTIDRGRAIGTEAGREVAVRESIKAGASEPRVCALGIWTCSHKPR